MNDAGDILVVYHTNRNDFPLSAPSLLQVEAVYFEFTQGATPAQDSWELISQQLVGSVEYSPLFTSYDQPEVNCERPDVVTDGERFFVTWTRRYDPEFNPFMLPTPPQEKSPAVMECAIIEKQGSTVYVHNDLSGGGTNLIGQGLVMTTEFQTRDCLGVADAVVLKQAAGGNPTFGVIYPAQTDFADIATPQDVTRKFDLNLVTCSIDPSTKLLTTAGPFLLASGVQFNGPTLPGGGIAQGLILPDAAPTDTINDFWLAYETQRLVQGNVLGAVRLGYIEYDSATNTWNPVAGKNFLTNNPQSIFLNRRPQVSSMPGGSLNEEVSIVFNFVPSQAGAAVADVFCEQWEYSGGGLQRLVAQAFPNSSNFSDGKPSVLHGPANPLIRHCYFGRVDAVLPSVNDGVFHYDVQTGFLVRDSISTTAARPAADYKLLGSSHTIALTWEDELYSSGGVDYKRIVLHPKSP